MKRRWLKRAVVAAVALFGLVLLLESCVPDKAAEEPWPGSVSADRRAEMIQRNQDISAQIKDSMRPDVAPIAPPVATLEGNRLTGLVPCGPEHPVKEQRNFRLWSDTGGVWTPTTVCRWYESKTVLGNFGIDPQDSWNNFQLEALPASSRPKSGSWYRIGLLHEDGAVEFVWAPRDEVNVDAVHLESVVRPVGQP